MQKITISQVIDDLEKPAKPGETYYTVDLESSKLVYVMCLDVLELLPEVKEFIEVIRVKWTAPVEMRVAPWEGAHLYAHIVAIVNTGYDKFEVETKLEVAYDFGGPSHMDLDLEPLAFAKKILEATHKSVQATAKDFNTVRGIVEKDMAGFSSRVSENPADDPNVDLREIGAPETATE